MLRCIERSMILGVKGTWNCIMNLEKTGRGFIGMRVTLKSLLRIMRTMSLLKMMIGISPHTGLPPLLMLSFFSLYCHMHECDDWTGYLVQFYSNNYSLKILDSLFCVSYVLLWFWIFCFKILCWSLFGSWLSCNNLCTEILI